VKTIRINKEKSNKWNATHNKVSPSVIFYRCRKLGITLPKDHPNRGQSRIDWVNVDWDVYNSELARRLDCSRELVRLMRVKFGNKKVLFSYVKPKGVWQNLYEIRKDKSQKWNSVNSGLSKSSISYRCRVLGIVLPKELIHKYDWTLYNKSLTVKQNAEIVGCTVQAIYKKLASGLL
jgi:hypothetical protein